MIKLNNQLDDTKVSELFTKHNAPKCVLRKIISIFHVFLVWMGKSIPRASCSKAVTRQASSPPMLHYALGMDFPIHTMNTWKILIFLLVSNIPPSLKPSITLLHLGLQWQLSKPVLQLQRRFKFKHHLPYNKWSLLFNQSPDCCWCDPVSNYNRRVDCHCWAVWKEMAISTLLWCPRL